MALNTLQYKNRSSQQSPLSSLLQGKELPEGRDYCCSTHVCNGKCKAQHLVEHWDSLNKYIVFHGAGKFWGWGGVDYGVRDYLVGGPILKLC